MPDKSKARDTPHVGQGFCEKRQRNAQERVSVTAQRNPNGVWPRLHYTSDAALIKLAISGKINHHIVCIPS